MIFGKRPKASSCTKLVPRWYMSHFKWSGTKLALLCTTMHRLRVPRWYPGGTQEIHGPFQTKWYKASTTLYKPCTRNMYAGGSQEVPRRYNVPQAHQVVQSVYNPVRRRCRGGTVQLRTTNAPLGRTTYFREG